MVQLAETFFSIGVTPGELIALSVVGNEAEVEAFHAAWVLENYFILQPLALDYYLPSLIESLGKVQNASVRRHFTKLIAIGIKRVITNKTPKVGSKELWQTNLDPLQELCFTWLLDPAIKPAVKVHCMEILYLLSSHFRWIPVDLPGVLESQMIAEGPAVNAKRREILKALSGKR